MKTDRIKKLAADYFKDIVAIRRHIHSHPELSFEEFNTAAFICSRLNEYGISFKKGIVKTGVVAEVKGKNHEKKTIALRADMDALPIEEKSNFPYHSQVKGVMHACGHDVHSASLIGTARILNELKNEWEGTVRFIFQPGEEKLPGGASLMIKEGVLENPKPSAIFAQHVFPSMEAGKVGFRPGMYMASTDEIYLTVKGKGGHAAMPVDYNNPVFIASAILAELNHHFMNADSDLRRKHIGDIPVVLAFGKFIADGATNIIPAEVKIEGTFRTMDEKWRKEAHQLIKDMAEKKAKEMGGSAEVHIASGYPFLVNDEELTVQAKKSAEEFLGKEKVEILELRMTAEDFAFYSHYLPSCFYRLGTGNKAKGIISGVHTSTFDIDETALETGMGLMAWIAIRQLS